SDRPFWYTKWARPGGCCQVRFAEGRELRNARLRLLWICSRNRFATRARNDLETFEDAARRPPHVGGFATRHPPRAGRQRVARVPRAARADRRRSAAAGRARGRAGRRGADGLESDARAQRAPSPATGRIHWLGWPSGRSTFD